MALNTRINLTWILLMILTLFSAAIAEKATPSHTIVIIICLSIAVKGRFVVDELMGLRCAEPIIRYSILSYFVLLPAFIALVFIYPEFLAKITTIN
jgi:hypothetical protein